MKYYKGINIMNINFRMGWIILALLTISVSVEAQTTLGQTANSEAASCVNHTIWVQSSSTGVSYVVPEAGTITSWSFSAGTSGSNTEALAILRPTGNPNPNYALVGITASQTVPANTTGTFPANLVVQAGDLIGLWIGSENGVKCYLATATDVADANSLFAPVIGGGLFLSPVNQNMQLNMSAVFMPLGSIPAAIPTMEAWALFVLVGLLTVAIALRRGNGS